MSAERLAPAHRRTVLRVIVVTQLCLALVTGIVMVLAYRNLDQGITPGMELEHRAKKQHFKDGDPLNVLVMGSDARAGAGNDIDGESPEGRRSDTTILVHISADRKTVYGVSLPRDALVTRPDCTTQDGETIAGDELQQFNTAFSLGGEKCATEMVESLTGIYIDHYVTLDFNGFKSMVDAVHGVTVCIPEDVDDREHGITLEAGTQELSGQQALDYVRVRSDISANADIGRMKRQQAFIASMINKVISAGTLTRPNRVFDFVKAATSSITVDPELASLSRMVDLARQFRNTALDDIAFITVPFQTYEPDPNRLVWAPEADELWKRILADKPLSKKYDGEVISADAPPGTPSEPPPDEPSGPASPSGSPADSPSASPDAAAKAAENGLCA